MLSRMRRLRTFFQSFFGWPWIISAYAGRLAHMAEAILSARAILTPILAMALYDCHAAFEFIDLRLQFFISPIRLLNHEI